MDTFDTNENSTVSDSDFDLCHSVEDEVARESSSLFGISFVPDKALAAMANRR
jgi:hypothetical protein